MRGKKASSGAGKKALGAAVSVGAAVACRVITGESILYRNGKGLKHHAPGGKLLQNIRYDGVCGRR